MSDTRPPHDRTDATDRPRPSWRRRRGAALPVVAALVSLGSVTMSALSVTLNAASSVMETRPVEVAGTALATLGPGPDLAVGHPMPELRGTTFDGQPVIIGRGGKPTMIVFLAHWCPHCQREVPLLAAWLRRGGSGGVEVFGVATATKRDWPNYPPSAWLTREGWPTPVLADDEQGTAAKAIGLTAYPFFVLVDIRGIVAHRQSGEISIAELEPLLAKVRGR